MEHFIPDHILTQLRGIHEQLEKETGLQYQFNIELQEGVKPGIIIGDFKKESTHHTEKTEHVKNLGLSLRENQEITRTRQIKSHILKLIGTWTNINVHGISAFLEDERLCVYCDNIYLSHEVDESSFHCTNTIITAFKGLSRCHGRNLVPPSPAYVLGVIKELQQEGKVEKANRCAGGEDAYWKLT